MRFSTCIVARMAPDTSQTAINAPIVAQNSCFFSSTWRTVWSITLYAAGDVVSCSFGATSEVHTSVSPNAPRSPRPSSASGISAKKT